jgi:phosphoenolpyruvate carboxylase
VSRAIPRRKRDPDANDKNVALIRDIRLLGRLLGEVIREQEGAAAYDLIERIRQLSVAFRLSATPALAQHSAGCLKHSPTRKRLA